MAVDNLFNENLINQSTTTENTQQTKVPNSDVMHSDTDDLVSKIFGHLVNTQCDHKFSFQPLYYHIGCAFFLLAFLAPSCCSHGPALYMRCMLTFGCLLLLMSSYLVDCQPDVLLWILFFIFVNLVHMAILICKLRPVKFEREIEEVSDTEKVIHSCMQR
jgi:hypothetical protein